MKNLHDLIWHTAYSRWYDHDHAGHPKRAQAWGRIADLIVRNH